MKKSKFSEEQIATAVRQVDADAPIPEVTRRLGISEATYYIWRKRYGQMAVAEIRRLRQLEDENRKLKQLVADLTLDKVMLQEVLVKKACRLRANARWRQHERVALPLACAELVGDSDSIARVGSIARIPGTIVPFGNGLLNSLTRDRGLGSSGFTSCSGEKDGSLTRSVCIAFIATKS